MQCDNFAGWSRHLPYNFIHYAARYTILNAVNKYIVTEIHFFGVKNRSTKL